MGNTSNLEIRQAYNWKLCCRSDDPARDKAAFRELFNNVKVGEKVDKAKGGAGIRHYRCYLFYLPRPHAVGGWHGSEDIKYFKRVAEDVIEAGVGPTYNDTVNAVIEFKLSDENKDGYYPIGL